MNFYKRLSFGIAGMLEMIAFSQWIPDFHEYTHRENLKIPISLRGIGSTPPSHKPAGGKRSRKRGPVDRVDGFRRK